MQKARNTVTAAKTFATVVKALPPCASPTTPPTTQLSSSPTPRKVSEKVVSTVKAAAEPPLPPLDAPRCPADILGWHVILTNMTNPATLNGEKGVVDHHIRKDFTDYFRVQLDCPRSSMKPSVMCFFSNLIPVKRGPPKTTGPTKKLVNKLLRDADANALEKSLVNLIAQTRGRRP